MPTVPQILKFRHARSVKEQYYPWSRIGLIVGMLVSLLMVTSAIVGIWYYLDLTQHLPSVNSFPALLEPPNGALLQPTRFYDRTHGHVILTLENPAAEGRQYLQLATNGQQGANQLSSSLVNATITALDPGFWEEPGYSLQGLSDSTHPTLAQQLVFSLVLENEPASLKRNIQERWLAAQITAQFGRQKVLEWYLNSAQYGAFVYGADAAALVYFGKSATILSIAEAAMLAAIAESPHLDPWENGQLLRDRQVQVIEAMLANGLISENEAREALRENVRFQASQDIRSLAPALTDLALMQISSELPLQRVYRGGYEIVTTLDYDLQLQATCASQEQLDRLQRAQTQELSDGVATCDAASLLPTIQAGAGKPLEGLKASVIVMEPQSGEVLAWVGEGEVDISSDSQTAHTAGSIVAPFLYLTYFARGTGPATMIWDLPQGDSNDISKEILASYQGPVRLRTALVNDYAGAAAQVLQNTGFDNVWQTEASFGIHAQRGKASTGTMLSDLYDQQISLLEAVRAYGVLDNQGVMVGHMVNHDDLGSAQDSIIPISVLKVDDIDGRILLDWSHAQTQPIVSDELAYLITDVLSDEKARSASQYRSSWPDIERPAAIKAGLTTDARDAWAIGYIPQLVVGVWMGSSQGETGGLTADMPAGLWQAVMHYASTQMPVQDFAVPGDISRVKVCDPSGLLITTICPASVEEVFLKGNEPTEMDNLYQEFLIDRETGILANMLTPKEQVEKKIFLVIPPEAIEWAKLTGLPIPPDTYDDITASAAFSPDVQITSPRMFDYVSGKIEVYGSAAGEGFSFYRLQVGQGLNPQQWIQIGDDSHQPVQDGLLGTWDTAGLDGLFIVQLMVVRQDRRVDRAILQVGVDNTLPQLQILAPKENALLAIQPGENMIIQVSAGDNMGLGRVEFYVDDENVSTLYEPPFMILWPAVTGKHSLLIRIYDLAGNQNTAQISFSLAK